MARHDRNSYFAILAVAQRKLRRELDAIVAMPSPVDEESFARLVQIQELARKAEVSRWRTAHTVSRLGQEELMRRQWGGVTWDQVVADAKRAAQGEPS